MQEHKRPDYPLMTKQDVQNIYHLQVPRWLFSDLRYKDMPMETKMAYAFLLNRHQLSRRNNWVNDRGEVYVIFPRKELAEELGVCEKRVTAAFKLLSEKHLIWEHRRGRGMANHIYMACVTPEENPNYTCAPFLEPDGDDTRTADLEGLDGEKPQEPPVLPSQNRKNDASRTAKEEVPEPPRMPWSNTYGNHTYSSQKEVSPSVPQPPCDGQTDESLSFEPELADILAKCELHCFSEGSAKVFENAIERLFYSKQFTIGDALLPQSAIRRKLHQLNGMVMGSVYDKLTHNTVVVRNSTAYTMSTILNAITELNSDCMLDADPFFSPPTAPPFDWSEGVPWR